MSVFTTSKVLMLVMISCLIFQTANAETRLLANIKHNIKHWSEETPNGLVNLFWQFPLGKDKHDAYPTLIPEDIDCGILFYKLTTLHKDQARLTLVSNLNSTSENIHCMDEPVLACGPYGGCDYEQYCHITQPQKSIYWGNIKKLTSIKGASLLIGLMFEDTTTNGNLSKPLESIRGGCANK
ncbi:MAG: hypothetical protein ACPGUD_05160 [Parashewanella sp.]